MPKRPSIKHLVAFVKYAAEETDRIDGLPGGPDRERALERLYGRLEAFELQVGPEEKQQAMKEAGIWQS